MGAIAHNEPASLLTTVGCVCLERESIHASNARYRSGMKVGRIGFTWWPTTSLAGFSQSTAARSAKILAMSTSMPPIRFVGSHVDSGYSEFLVWAMSAKLHDFYDSLRWDDWLSEVKQLTGDQAINIYPFLWAKGAPLKSVIVAPSRLPSNTRCSLTCNGNWMGIESKQRVALDRASITVFRNITFLAACPASERNRSPFTEKQTCT